MSDKDLIKPVKIMIERWDCGQGHMHKTERAAMRCIPAVRCQQFANRNKKIVAMWADGNTFTSIGKQFNLSVTRVSEIVFKSGRYYYRAKRKGSDLSKWSSKLQARFESWKKMDYLRRSSDLYECIAKHVG